MSLASSVFGRVNIFCVICFIHQLSSSYDHQFEAHISLFAYYRLTLHLTIPSNTSKRIAIGIGSNFVKQTSVFSRNLLDNIPKRFSYPTSRASLSTTRHTFSTTTGAQTPTVPTTSEPTTTTDMSTSIFSVEHKDLSLEIPPPGSPFDTSLPTQDYPYPLTIPHPFLPLPPLETSPNDDREYSAFILPNGLRCVVISDSHATQGACSLDVFTGHQSDGTLSGCAHFTEHMLFMGTEKYPEEDGYSKFLAANGGSSNAYTSGQHTNYYFNVSVDSLESAVDRFSNFFICPLFSVSSTGREVNAVDSEFLQNVNQDGRRRYHLSKGLSNPCLPESQFGSGNKATLLYNREDASAYVLGCERESVGVRAGVSTSTGVDTSTGVTTDMTTTACTSAPITVEQQALHAREHMMQFFRKNYSANNMCVCLLGKQKIPELQKMVAEKFGGIRNFNKIPEYGFCADIDKWAPMSLEDLQKLRARTGIMYTTNPEDMWGSLEKRRYILPEYVQAGKEGFQQFLEKFGKSEKHDKFSGYILPAGIAAMYPHSHTDIPGVTSLPTTTSSALASSTSTSTAAPAPLVRECAYPGLYGRVHYVMPITDVRDLTLQWTLPPLRRSWLTPAGDILAHIIGYEGNGSLKSFLQSEGLVSGLGSYCSNLSPDNASFAISVALTKVGILQVDKIIRYIFEYLLLVCNTNNQHLLEITEDMIQTSKNKFQFQEKKPPGKFVTNLAEDMHAVTVPPLLPLPISESLIPDSETRQNQQNTQLSEKPMFASPSDSDIHAVSQLSNYTPSLLLRYDDMLVGMQKDSIYHLLALLTPSRVRIDVVGKEVAQFMPLTQREGHYGVLYGVSKIATKINCAASDLVANTTDIDDVDAKTSMDVVQHPAMLLAADPNMGSGTDTSLPFRVNDTIVCDEYGHGLLYWPWMRDIEQHMYALLTPYAPDFHGFRKKHDISEEIKTPEISSPLLPHIRKRVDTADASFQSIATDVLKQYISLQGCHILGKNSFIPKSFKIPVEPLPENTPLTSEGVPEKWTWDMLGLFPVSIAANLMRTRDAHGALSPCKLSSTCASMAASTGADVMSGTGTDVEVSPPGSFSTSPSSSDVSEADIETEVATLMPDEWYLRNPTPEEILKIRTKYPENTSLVDICNLALRERIPLRYRIQKKTPILVNYTEYSENWYVPQISHITSESVHTFTVAIPGTITHANTQNEVYLDILLKYIGQSMNNILYDASDAGILIDIDENENGITFSTSGYMEPNFKAILLVCLASRQAISNIAVGKIISNEEFKNFGLYPSNNLSSEVVDNSDPQSGHYLISGLNLDVLSTIVDNMHRVLLSSIQKSPLDLSGYLIAQLQEDTNSTRIARLQEILHFRKIISEAMEAYSQRKPELVYALLSPFFNFVRAVLGHISIVSLSAGCSQEEAVYIARKAQDIFLDASLSQAAAPGSHLPVLKSGKELYLNAINSTISMPAINPNTTSTATSSSTSTPTSSPLGVSIAAMVKTAHIYPLLPIAVDKYPTHANTCLATHDTTSTSASTNAWTTPLRCLPFPLALAHADRVHDRTVLAQPGEHVFFRVHATNHNDKNNAARVTFQLPQHSPRTSALTSVLTQLMAKKIFNELRTKETLGYIVRTQATIRNSVGMLSVSVQGLQDATYLYQRIETALLRVRQEIEDMQDGDIYSTINALISNHSATSESFTQHARAYLRYIQSGSYDFGRIWDVIQELRQINKNDILEFMDEYVLGYSVKDVVSYGTYKDKKGDGKTEIQESSTLSPFYQSSTLDYDISLTRNVLRGFPMSELQTIYTNTNGLGDSANNAQDVGLQYSDINPYTFQNTSLGSEISDRNTNIPDVAKVIFPTRRSMYAILVNHHTQPFPSYPLTYAPVRGNVDSQSSEKPENTKKSNSEVSVAVPLEPTVVPIIAPENITLITDISAYRRSHATAACAMRALTGSLLLRAHVRRYIEQQRKK